LEECFLDFVVDYLSIFLDFGMVFYSYAIIFFMSRIVVIGTKWEVGVFSPPLQSLSFITSSPLVTWEGLFEEVRGFTPLILKP
jgi:hypothetical protein